MHGSIRQPVFIGLKERKKEKLEKEQQVSSDVLEIDLDEDDPLCEEYLPRRRTSVRSSSHDYEGNQQMSECPVWTQMDNHSLPPPAK